MSKINCDIGYKADKWACPVCGGDGEYIDAYYADGESLTGNDLKFYEHRCGECGQKYTVVTLEVFIGVQTEGTDY